MIMGWVKLLKVKFVDLLFFYSRVAQLVEQDAVNIEVEGSSPFSGAIYYINKDV
jgi:hypothetical protein